MGWFPLHSATVKFLTYPVSFLVQPLIGLLPINEGGVDPKNFAKALELEYIEFVELSFSHLNCLQAIDNLRDDDCVIDLHFPGDVAVGLPPEEVHLLENGYG